MRLDSENVRPLSGARPRVGAPSLPGRAQGEPRAKGAVPAGSPAARPATGSVGGRRNLETDTIDKIFRQTLQTLTDAREQIFDIAESARSEYDRLSRAVAELKEEVTACVELVDQLEREARKARAHLARVSSDFARHSQQAIRAAYEAAEEVHVRLSAARERERELRKKRDELERSLVNLGKMVEKAENMVSQVSVAMEYLAGSVERIANQWEGIKARYQIGERVIRAQEEERRRVAREIHDGPAQAMANVVLRAEICERLYLAGREEVTQELAQLKVLVKESLRELRRIIFNLRPMALDDLGLVPTLNRYLENLREQEGTPVRLAVAGREVRLPSAVEVAVFRMVQEAVNNARKHAQASRIQVGIQFVEGEAVVIVVEDDGIGFDMEALKQEWVNRESFGLMSMKERIELLGGEFEVTSAPGRGTRIVARLPFEEMKERDE